MSRKALPREGLVSHRPFRAPHHTISDVALVGGGAQPRPGEISLAHHGVLFLDETPEFDRRVLDVLRQPLEEGQVRIARASRTVAFPARFQLVAAMNPCPCGFLTDPVKPCTCSAQQVHRYRHRMSGPLRNRIDLSVEVPPVPIEHLTSEGAAEASAVIAARVVAARDRQRARYPTTAGIHTTARRRRPWFRTPAHLAADARRLLEQAAVRQSWSARVFDRVLKVARTVADLSGHDRIEARACGRGRPVPDGRPAAGRVDQDREAVTGRLLRDADACDIVRGFSPAAAFGPLRTVHPQDGSYPLPRIRRVV